MSTKVQLATSKQLAHVKQRLFELELNINEKLAELRTGSFAGFKLKVDEAIGRLAASFDTMNAEARKINALTDTVERIALEQDRPDLAARLTRAPLVDVDAMLSDLRALSAKVTTL
jgi:hypothetical protein